MRRRRLIIIGIIASLLVIGLAVWWVYQWQKSPQITNTETVENQPAKPVESAPEPAAPNPPPEPVNPHGLTEPIEEFKSRITKKRHGTHITPATSPVQPERFSGYHAGVDVEYEDVTEDVPVNAIADGQIVYSQWVQGYGGVTILQLNIDSVPRLALYGHVRPNSWLPVGTTVSKGQQIGVLGTGYSQETDNERRHLHFAILQNTSINLRGYVASPDGLSAWLDPLSLYP